MSKWAAEDKELNKTMRFPISLNKFILEWKDLSMIGSLPQLQVLQLGANSIMDGQEWSPIKGQFMRLKILKINNCDLKYWDADSSHFLVLEKLLLTHLFYLEEIPLVRGETGKLELIRVDCCRESAVISALKMKENEVENQGNDAL